MVDDKVTGEIGRALQISARFESVRSVYFGSDTIFKSVDQVKDFNNKSAAETPGDTTLLSSLYFFTENGLDVGKNGGNLVNRVFIGNERGKEAKLLTLAAKSRDEFFLFLHTSVVVL